MKRCLCALILILTLISLCGCSGLPDAEYQALREGRLRYEYETIEAVITDIDTRHWFAGTHWWEWKVEVYYEEYDLTYKEEDRTSGAFSCPSLFNDKKGDTIKAQVKNTYIDDELTDRKIIRLY